MIYRSGSCTLDTSRRELRRGDGLVAVEPQVFDVLKYLIEARDRVVSRDDLLDAVWQRRIVSEATLSSRLNSARTAVGDSGAQQRLIRTLPRKGVRFVGAVQVAGAAPEPPGIEAPEDAIVWRLAAKSPSVAVLPFTNMSGDPEQDYFAEGVAEEIIAASSRSSGLFVVARNSSAYKGRPIDVRQVGQQLGVGYVLEGSVRRGRERLRITGQLVDAASGAYLWSERFAVALRVLAVALVKLGEQARAEKIVRELLEIEPELTISDFFARIPVPLDSMAKTYAEALKAAGLPD